MDGAATPLTGGADNAQESISRPIPIPLNRAQMRLGNKNVDPAHGRSTPNRPSIVGTSSIASSTTSSSSTCSSTFDYDSSRAGTPLTPPLSKKRIVSPSRTVNLRRGVSKLSFTDTVPNGKSNSDYNSSQATQRPSTPRLEEWRAESESGGLVSDDALSFRGLETHDKSPVSQKVNRMNLKGGVEGGTDHISEFLETLDAESKDTDPCQEVDEKSRAGKGKQASSHVIDSRSPKKTKADGSSTPKTSPLSENIDGKSGRGPLVTATAKASKSALSTPNRPAKPSSKADSDTTAVSTTAPHGQVDDGACSGSVDGVAPSPQNPRKRARRKPARGTLKPDEAKAIVIDLTAEWQVSTTSGPTSDSVAQEPNCDADAAEILQPSQTEISKKTAVNPVKNTNLPRFEKFSKAKSTNDVKVAILRAIRQSDKEKTPKQPKTSLNPLKWISFFTTVTGKKKTAKEGFIYVYKVDILKGYVKIGKSNETQGKRVSDWGKKCEFETEHISDPDDKQFLHCGIVETLVHAELSDKRWKYKCATCKKKGRHQLEDAREEHGEWFTVTEAHALEVVERWRGWIVHQQPYRRNGTLRGIWIWKHDQAVKTRTVDFAQWVILRWFDWPAYVCYEIDKYLKAELHEILPLLRVSILIYAGIIMCIWLAWGPIPTSIITIAFIAINFRYS
jgi:hypothetical protein